MSHLIKNIRPIMKKLIFIIYLFHTAFSLAQNRDSFALINGYIANSKDSSFTVYEMGLADIFKAHNGKIQTTIDDQGNFHMRIPMTAPLYFKIFDKRVYLRPDDSLYIEINADNEIAYSGRHLKSLNDYLRDLPYQQGGAFYDNGKNIVLDADSTVSTMIGLFNNKLEDLHKIREYLSGDIFLHEKNRLWCLALKSSSRITLATQYMVKYNISQDSAQFLFSNQVPKLQALQAEAIKEIQIDEQILTLEDFVGFVNYFTNISKDKTVLVLLNEFSKATNINDKVLKVKNASDLQAVRDMIAGHDESRYRNILQENLTSVSKAFRDTPYFKFNDLDGNHITLETFKGKTVYLEVWATWCAPCIRLKPSLNQLHALYSDRDDIVFVSISIDRDRTKWRDYLKDNPSPLVELVAYQDFVDYFSINTIPRSIMIGPNGKLLEWNAPNPNDIRLREAIDNTL